MEYRDLKLGEIKRDGDELIGAHWLPDGAWRAVRSELGRKVTKGDLAWGSYRRPLKSKVAASSTSSNNDRSAIALILEYKDVLKYSENGTYYRELLGRWLVRVRDYIAQQHL